MRSARYCSPPGWRRKRIGLRSLILLAALFMLAVAWPAMPVHSSPTLALRGPGPACEPLSHAEPTPEHTVIIGTYDMARNKLTWALPYTVITTTEAVRGVDGKLHRVTVKTYQYYAYTTTRRVHLRLALVHNGHRVAVKLERAGTSTSITAASGAPEIIATGQYDGTIDLVVYRADAPDRSAEGELVVIYPTGLTLVYDTLMREFACRVPPIASRAVSYLCRPNEPPLSGHRHAVPEQRCSARVG